jgi:hypothetical protein
MVTMRQSLVKKGKLRPEREGMTHGGDVTVLWPCSWILENLSASHVSDMEVQLSITGGMADRSDECLSSIIEIYIPPIYG